MTNAEALIYVSLDALFDTRLSTLHRLDQEKSISLLSDGYFSRDYDEFPGFDLEAYNALYAKRDLETLRHAVVTDVPRLILFFAEKTLKARASTPWVSQPKLHLNTYPYKLPDPVAFRIIEGVKILTKGLIDIELVDFPMSDLTPKRVKEKYAALIMYDYWEWLEHHAAAKNFDNVFCPEVSLFGPAIVRSKAAWEEVKGVNIYAMIEQYSSMFIKLQLYPVTTFSVDLERMMKTKKVESGT